MKIIKICLAATLLLCSSMTSALTLDEAKQQAVELENSAAAAEEEKRRAERRLKDAEEAVTRNDNIKAGLKLKLESRRRQQAEAADALQKADKERPNTSQRIHILEDLERNMDGYQQSVKAVMRAAGAPPRPRSRPHAACRGPSRSPLWPPTPPTSRHRSPSPS